MPKVSAAELQTTRGDRIACWSLFLSVFLLHLVHGVSADGNVTLEFIQIATTHELFAKPVVYFFCQGGEKVYLPDVKEKNTNYSYMGLESFQPLTSFEGPKCKRCGIYEEDWLRSDDVFYEGELCPSYFSPSPENRYTIFAENELNVSLICVGCHPGESVAVVPSAGVEEEEEHGEGLKMALSVLLGLALVGVCYGGYLLYRRKQRAEQQKRFIQLFEDDEDLDEELGLKDGL